MHIIINHSSMVPIYEQIVDRIKTEIGRGTLAPDTMLPSVRGLSNQLKISALTVKKAYDCLEEQGYVVTVHGKGTFVAETDAGLLSEIQQKEVEEALALALAKAKGSGMNAEQVRRLFGVMMEEYYD